MRIYNILILIIITFLSCECRHPRKNVPLFINEAFQDTLETYIDAVSGVKTDCGFSVNMTILCVGGKDTTLFMTTGIVPCQWDGLVFKGGCEINGFVCLVNYVNIESMPNFINESALSFEKERYEYYFDVERLLMKSYDFEIDETTSKRRYKLHGLDSLQIISQYICPMEKGYVANGKNYIVFE